MSHSEIIEILERAMDVAPGTIYPEANLKDLGWDSLADIVLIGMLDEHLGKVIDPGKLASCAIAQDYINLIEQS